MNAPNKWITVVLASPSDVDEERAPAEHDRYMGRVVPGIAAQQIFRALRNHRRAVVSAYAHAIPDSGECGSDGGRRLWGTAAEVNAAGRAAQGGGRAARGPAGF